MKIALSPWTPGSTIPGVRKQLDSAIQHDLDGFWMTMTFALDPITALASLDSKGDAIDIGTAVVPAFPRHPILLAQQALTLQSAVEGHFSLGVGASHRVMMEGALGLSYDEPTARLREYLTVLGAALESGSVQFEGKFYKVEVELEFEPAVPPSLLVGALGPRTLRMAGELSDGVITTLLGARSIEEHVGPTVREAAAEVGRPEPEIHAIMPMALTDRPERAKAQLPEMFGAMDSMPAYRSVLEREQVETTRDLVMVGDEATLDETLERMRASGVTSFIGIILPIDPEATIDYLGRRAAGRLAEAT